MSHLLEDHPDWPKNAMTTPTPLTGIEAMTVMYQEEYELRVQKEKELAAALDLQAAYFARCEQLCDALAAAQEARKAAEEELRENEGVIAVWRGRTKRAEALAESLKPDAERWKVCLDAQGVAVSIFNVDPPCWRYPEGDRLVAAIDAIRTGADGAWSVPIDDGSRSAFSLTAQSRESVEARFYRYLRDEAGQYDGDTDGPMICAGLGDQFDYLRGEECDEAIRKAIDARAAIAEGKK